MAPQFILPLADSNATLENVGGKGASLARLVNADLPVPDGFHVTTAAYRQFVAQNDLQLRILAALKAVDGAQPTTLDIASRVIYDLFANAPMPQEIAGEISCAYTDLRNSQFAIRNSQLPVAVRSSATAEDLPDLSFAGQQETFLNIQGAVAVQDAVKRCWASLWTPRAIGYRAQHQIDHNAVALAVVVQILIDADAAGVMFTANPVNGRRDQNVINAAFGLGEAVVGGRVTPDTLVLDKTSGRVIERDIAEKTVMTVRRESGTEEQSVPEDKRRVPVLSDAQAAELSRLGARIENLYQMPMDIEWTLAQNKFAVVQARPITALPELEPPPPTEWKLPNPKGQYMRVSVVDLMPDPVSPLFATMGLDALNAGIHRMLSDALNSESPLDKDLFVTINEYAYEGAHFTARQWWWLLSQMIPKMLRIFRTAVARWRDVVLPRYTETARRWQVRSLADLSAPELWMGIREIAGAAMYNLASQMAWMGACAGSEGLFTRVYEKMIKRAGDPAATTFVMGYDSAPIRAEKSLYDLARWLRMHAEFAARVSNTASAQLAAEIAHDEIPANVNADNWREWQNRFRSHMQQFGHTIYDLDFAKSLPLDDPAPMFETIKMYLRGEGHNPHERQQSAEAKRIAATENVLRRVKRVKRWAFIQSLNWAQSLAEVREDGIAAIGIGYPALRKMLLELGARLIRAGALEHPGDIFWLRQNEIEKVVTRLGRGDALDSMADQVRQRQASARAAKRVTPPPMLPPKKKYMGFSMEGVVAADEGSHTANTIKGVGASAGQVTAAARVLRGSEDFDQMRPGEVLVAGITTPAWTPLFAMASAVVTDVGGPLSHGSIVAREYGIPAVLGTGVATKRIRSGQMITVDGSAGIVTLPKSAA